jgi:hypothetical protein
VPFLKFSRDKRGYENFYLIEPPSSGRRGGKSKPRVLFWFRTPPQVKVGRAPFSDEVQKMVEAQYPSLTFDWPRIIATPIPPPDLDHWRERRRLEKAAKRAAREDEEADAEATPEVVEPVETVGVESAGLEAGAAVVAEIATEGDAAVQVVTELLAAAEDDVADEADDDGAGSVTDEVEVDAVADGVPAETQLAASDAQGTLPRKRRRRRRGRRGRSGQPGVPGQPVSEPVTAATSPEPDASVEPGIPPTNEV